MFPVINLSSIFNCYRPLNRLSNSLIKEQILCSKRNISLSYFANQIRNDESPVYIFDRKAKVLQRERAAISEDVQLYDYVKNEMGFRLADRVYDIKRKFRLAADIGNCSIFEIV